MVERMAQVMGHQSFFSRDPRVHLIIGVPLSPAHASPRGAENARMGLSMNLCIQIIGGAETPLFSARPVQD